MVVANHGKIRGPNQKLWKTTSDTLVLELLDPGRWTSLTRETPKTPNRNPTTTKSSRHSLGGVYDPQYSTVVSRGFLWSWCAGFITNDDPRWQMATPVVHGEGWSAAGARSNEAGRGLVGIVFNAHSAVLTRTKRAITSRSTPLIARVAKRRHVAGRVARTC